MSSLAQGLAEGSLTLDSGTAILAGALGSLGSAMIQYGIGALFAEKLNFLGGGATSIAIGTALVAFANVFAKKKQAGKALSGAFGGGGSGGGGGISSTVGASPISARPSSHLSEGARGTGIDIRVSGELRARGTDMWATLNQVGRDTASQTGTDTRHL